MLTAPTVNVPNPASEQHQRFGVALWLLLILAVFRLWIMPLPSSLWVDETVTVFVAEHPGDPSLIPVPQVPASIYYAIPRALASVFGRSEILYRLPSLFFMALALWLAGRIAARLIHPDARWFAVFLCLTLRWFNFYADDARPYAMGIAVASASVWFLIRWLDTAEWRDAALFALCAALLWRVHLLYWPFYLVFALYAAVRLLRRETKVTWKFACGVASLVVFSLIPVALDALRILHTAGEHVFIAVPGLREMEHLVRWSVVALAAGGAWLAAKLLRWPAPESRVAPSALLLCAAWWLGPALCLFIYSRVTGNSVFVDRYISLQLPGIALTATLAASRRISPTCWRPAACVVAIVAFALMGKWTTLWPRHDNSDWRAAAQAVNAEVAAADPETPVLCASPFIEAHAPVWRPDYSLPGFLYAHLAYYPLRGRLHLLPFDRIEANVEAGRLMAEGLREKQRFLLYGGQGNVDDLRNWLAARPELSGWRESVAHYGDVGVTIFRAPELAGNTAARPLQ